MTKTSTNLSTGVKVRIVKNNVGASEKMREATLGFGDIKCRAIGIKNQQLNIKIINES